LNPGLIFFFFFFFFLNHFRQRTMSVAVSTEQMSGVPYVSASVPESASVETRTLGNGVKVATRLASAGSATVKISIGAGSALETTGEKGAAHLLGTSMFSGTGKQSGIAMIRALDDLGAVVDASSSRTDISMGVTFPSDNADDVMDIMTEIITSPPPSYIYSDMKGVAQLSYDALKSDPQAMLSELIYEAAFGEEGIGASMFAKNLGGLSPDAVASFRASKFSAANMVVASSGVDVSGAFESLSGGTAVAPVKSSFVGGEIKVKLDYGNASNVAIAFEMPGGDGSKALEILQNHLTSKFSDAPLVPFCSSSLMGFYSCGASTAVSATLSAVMAEIKAVAGGVSTGDAILSTILSKAIAKEGNCADLLLDMASYGQGAADYSGITAAKVSSAAAAAVKAPAYAILGSVPGTPTLKSLM
jgi:hypothetical protein